MGKLDGGGMWSLLFLLATLFATCYSQSVPVINMSSVELREDLKKGAWAFKISAYDLDGDPLTYGITNDYGHFDVDPQTGDVYIAIPLDRETKENFQVDVSVDDGEHLPTEKKIVIVVLDANDNAPTFVNEPYSLNLLENTTVGTTVMKVTATDPDYGQAGVVYYSIDQANPLEGLDVFSISRRDGDIVLNEPLDFTEKSKFYQLQINASDGGGPLGDNPNYVQSTIGSAYLTIIDVPNRDPEFVNLPTTIRVKEHTSVGESVFLVRARDPDTGINDVIRYSIQAANANGLFEINPDTGIVTAVADVDREALLDIDALVQLTVKATEASLDVNGVYASATATLTIQIEDVNDNPPLFYKCDGDACVQTNDFSAEVDEHTAAGLSITGLNMRVKDMDAGENSRFQLSLEGPAKDLFSVSPASDMSDRAVQILVKNPDDVDYERNKTLTVQVVAQDAGETTFVNTATVTIKVNDINDNTPIFAEDVYELFAPEHCENGLILRTITATDADELDYGRLTYKLRPDSLLDLFDVFTNNGTVYVKNGAKLDRERKNSYPATLQAIDLAGNVGSTVLEITIEDINDQTPQFYRNKYETFIRENEVLEAQVEARDDDEPDTPNSQIKYAIEPGDYSDNFTINEDTGLIKSNGPLDREAIDIKLDGKITLNVTATDMGTPPLSSWVYFIVYVEDVNDNPPVFLQSEYTFHVNESERGAFVGNVYATDADQTTNNNRISFSIKNVLFLCVSEPDGAGYQGMVRVDPDVELDYEKEVEHTITVEATDMGGNSDTCTVHILVDDINDTPPDFPEGITMQVDENTPAGMVIGKINGTDVDTTALLVYERVSSMCYYNRTWAPCVEEWFDVKSDGSVITAEGVTIDYEECTQVKMTARVVDLNTQKGSNSYDGIITINIIDVNDNAPVFHPVQDFFVLIAENIEEGKSVARVDATDRDSGDNKIIEFEVVHVEFATNTDETPQVVDLIFSAVTGQPDPEERYIGIIRSKNTLQADKEGKYLVTVMAKNGILSTNETLKLITVDKSYKVGLKFSKSVTEVNANLDDIRFILASATKAMVHVVNVSPETSRVTQRNVVTLLEAYYVFRNGTALNSESIGKILNSQSVYEEYGHALEKYGLEGISGNVPTEKTNNTVLFIMVGLVAALVIVLIVTTTSMVCIRKKYKTKLKAAKAMNTAAMAGNEYQKDGPVVPGTNKYTREGANPVLNLNIDASTDLGFDEEASSADRESLSSLDDNMDMNTSDKDTMPMMAIEEEEDENDHSYIEPLDAALAQRGKKKGSASPSVTFSNPAFDTTTDL